MAANDDYDVPDLNLVPGGPGILWVENKDGTIEEWPEVTIKGMGQAFSGTWTLSDHPDFPVTIVADDEDES